MVKTIDRPVTTETNRFDVTVQIKTPEVQPVHYDLDYKDLVVPSSHEERMAWIRSSFNSFFKHVQERDEVTK